MSAHPYRETTLTAPADETPPLWQRIAARVAPELLGARRWQWYRRKVGGRWCRVRAWSDVDGAFGARDEGTMWVRVQCCPQPVTIGRQRYGGVYLAESLPLPDEWALTPLHAVDERGRCTCEVWP